MRFLLLAALALSGCATHPDGSITLGAVESPYWHESTPRAEIDRHYDEMETYQLCILWEKSRNKEYVREEISKSLKRRGDNPLRCYLPTPFKAYDVPIPAAAPRIVLNGLLLDAMLSCPFL